MQKISSSSFPKKYFLPFVMRINKISKRNNNMHNNVYLQRVDTLYFYIEYCDSRFTHPHSSIPVAQLHNSGW